MTALLPPPRRGSLDPSADLAGAWAAARVAFGKARVGLAARAVVMQRLADGGPCPRLEATKLELARRHDWYAEQAQGFLVYLCRAGARELADGLWAEHARLQRERTQRMVEGYRARRRG